MMVQNPFDTAAAAKRYQRGRPFHHPQATGRILSVLGKTHVGRVLDVACGTGLSTIALADHAQLVVGVDASEAMVAAAPARPHVLYGVAEAETLPFNERTFELVTVASGVHWFRQGDFFDEVARVLQRGECLFLYDHPFKGCIDEPAIDEWLEERFEKRYPTPSHGPRPDEPLAEAPRFHHLAPFVYDDEIRFTQDEFISYLLSNSNTIEAESLDRETLEESETWLRTETDQWFESTDSRSFLFCGIVRSLRLMD